MDNFVFIFIIFIYVFSSYTFAHRQYDIQDLLRRKRTLLFPNPLNSETKVQVLFGLGLPMEGAVSMTLGYVLKCNYKLPYNASDFTPEPYVRYARDVDLNMIQERSTAASKDTGTISRWSLYRILEIAMESEGSSGKACLLRAVCEAAEIPFQNDLYGLIHEFLRVVLTPSTTSDEYEMYADREYRAAELIGENSHGDACESAYPECLYSPLDYFTRKMSRTSFLP